LRILLIGKNGQAGSALQRALAHLGVVIATDRAGLDLLDLNSIREKTGKEKPDVIVNAAAYTAVDRAETDRAAAFAVNASAVEVLAGEAKRLQALLVHFSSDYVFDGDKTGAYTEADAPAPINVYGESKLAGERLVTASGCRHFIFRTSWVYGPRGRNFLCAILAAARAKPELRVVDDQHGAPTSGEAIAAAVAQILSDSDLSKMPSGIFHLSAAGQTTWHGFAKEILARNALRTPVMPISSAEHSAQARRPKNSLLDNAKLKQTFGVALPDWRQGLSEISSKINTL